MVYRVQDANVRLTHLVAHAPLPLGVLCRQCSHRALVQQETLGVCEGNMKSLLSLRFKCKSCQRRGDGKDQFWLFLFHGHTEPDDFIVQEQTREP